MPRLTAGDVACWVLKTSSAPAQLAPGWAPGTARVLTRCVRASYRLDLMAPGRPCLLWLSGRHDPGVHALGSVHSPVQTDAGGTPAVAVRLTLLPDPVARADLLADPRVQDAEVLRMPAGSNPSWLSAAQFEAVLDRLAGAGLEPWPA
jgi:hypothetical protein